MGKLEIKSYLMLVQDGGNVDLSGLYDAFSSTLGNRLELRFIGSFEKRNLRQYFEKSVELNKYIGVVLFLRFKSLERQVRYLKKLNKQTNIIFYEHDACQNYMEYSKYRGRFAVFYKKIPNCRVVVSGFNVAKKLYAEGIDVHFIPKGCDMNRIQQCLKDDVVRDIGISFIGSLTVITYKTRKQFLALFQKEVPSLQIYNKLTTQKYFETLQRSKFFICPDVGFGEYMIKNYEAMSTGCVLLTYDQGAEENKALGFVDNENVILFKSLEDCIKRYSEIKDNVELIQKISNNAQKLIIENYGFRQIADRFSVFLDLPFHLTQESTGNNFFEKLKVLLNWKK